MLIGILGYGAVGQKLAQLFADAGHTITIGLRKATSAEVNNIPYAVASIAETAANVDALVLAIPHTAAIEALKELAPLLKGKIVIDSTNPLQEDWSPLLLGQENSAGEEIQRLLPESHVVKAFNTIFADVMHKNAIGQPISAFVAGNNAHAKEAVMHLAQAAGFSPINAGDISSARYLEAMAHLNIRLAVSLGGGTHAAFLYYQAKNNA
jgi:predicted dinucleotide-binding enzyme